MFLFYFSILLAILSTLLYQVAQKLTPAGANPALAIATTYVTAVAICLVVLALYPPHTSLAAAFRQLNWTSFALAFAVAGIEFGFLLAFRAGWPLGLTGLFVLAAATLLLVPIGLVFFKEKLSPINIVGIVLCLAGLVMINWKK